MVPNYKEMNPSEFKKEMVKKYNGKSLRGLELMNAAGDINQTSLAYQYATDMLTYIRQKIVEQTFYEIPIADYVPVLVGEGAFSAQIITNLSIKMAGSFQQGKLNTGNANSKVAIADAGVVPIYTKVMNWALGIEYTVFDVNQSLFTGVWDIIEAKHRARKKDFDLGIQAQVFIGDPTDNTNFPGLLTAPTVNTNTAVITGAISSMTAAGFATFVSTIVATYLSNNAYTRFPNVFLIPTDDWAGLATPVSTTYPNISMLNYLQQAFDAICQQHVKILPCAYGIPANNKTVINIGTGKHVYCLYNDDVDTLFMELPVSYTTTQVGTLNNFNFQDVAYAQYTGVQVLKPLEVLLFTY